MWASTPTGVYVTIPNPESRIPNPESRIPNRESRTYPLTTGIISLIRCSSSARSSVLILRM